MKLLFAGLVAGIVLGSSSLAFGMSQWRSGGTTYSCSGSSTTVFCKETNWRGVYQVGIYPSAVSVAYRGNLIFHCNRKFAPAGNCTYYGR